MASIFIAVPQHKAIPDAEVQRLKEALNCPEWQTENKGFHPMFDIAMCTLFKAKRHKMKLATARGDGNLPRVRASLAAAWKRDWDNGEKYDYILMLDEDISFTPEAIDILVEDDKPIIGGIYTFKTNDEYYQGKVCTRLLSNYGTMDAPFEVRWLNGGFILIKAEAMLDLIEKYKHLEFSCDPIDGNIQKSWAIWCPMVYEKLFLAEDWAFCQRAKEVGYKIYADWRVKLWHWNNENGFSITPRIKDGQIMAE